MTNDSPITAGIDVGGARKGHHCVILVNGIYQDQFKSNDPEEIAEWCRSKKAQTIAIDAPCNWSQDGKARACERDLIKAGIQCFPSPTRETAISHPTNYYGWMIEGEKIYQTLSSTHSLLIDHKPKPTPLIFETFPHAITYHLQGGQARAADKQQERRALLNQLGIQLPSNSGIDQVDAALCAKIAHHFMAGKPCQFYGEPKTGFIVCPKQSRIAPTA